MTSFLSTLSLNRTRANLVEPPARSEARRVNLTILCLLALVVGVMTGVGAVALRMLIGLIHNICFNGRFDYHYDANILEGPSAFGDWVLLAPVLGGLIVVYLVRTFAPEAKGHGVPEVMDAIFYKNGNIRGLVAVIKSLASALSIGSGAAVGREGPIIQIGSALGSAFSRGLGLSTSQKITLLSAGAGAGIAATFNTPLGGVLFALEILLPEVSNRTFLPVVIATGAATMLGRILIGPDPAFRVPLMQLPPAHSFGVEEALAYIVLGALVGIAAWAFIRLLVLMEDGFPKIPGGEYVQNIIGMAIVGLMIVALTRAYGHSYVDGVGYGVIQQVLDNHMALPGLLALLFVMKLLATTISLGCGASGGIFSPSLYLGSTLGAAFATVASGMLPEAGLTAPAAAIVGMAAMVGAGTGGVMTGIVMVFEMTRDYAIIVPVIAAVAVAAGVRRALISETIYTVKLRHRGHRIPKERHVNLYLVKQTQDVMERRFVLAKSGSNLADALSADSNDEALAVIVEREGRIAGLVPPRSGLWREYRRNPDAIVDDFMEPQIVLCRNDDLLSVALSRLKRHGAGAAIVYGGHGRPRVKDIVGILTKRAIADTVIDNYED
jgi:CIC family chloride channel protein